MQHVDLPLRRAVGPARDLVGRRISNRKTRDRWPEIGGVTSADIRALCPVGKRWLCCDLSHATSYTTSDARRTPNAALPSQG